MSESILYKIILEENNNDINYYNDIEINDEYYTKCKKMVNFICRYNIFSENCQKLYENCEKFKTNKFKDSKK